MIKKTLATIIAGVFLLGVASAQDKLLTFDFLRTDLRGLLREIEKQGGPHLVIGEELGRRPVLISCRERPANEVIERVKSVYKLKLEKGILRPVKPLGSPQLRLQQSTNALMAELNRMVVAAQRPFEDLAAERSAVAAELETVRTQKLSGWTARATELSAKLSAFPTVAENQALYYFARQFGRLRPNLVPGDVRLMPAPPELGGNFTVRISPFCRFVSVRCEKLPNSDGLSERIYVRLPDPWDGYDRDWSQGPDQVAAGVPKKSAYEIRLPNSYFDVLGTFAHSAGLPYLAEVQDTDWLNFTLRQTKFDSALDFLGRPEIAGAESMRIEQGWLLARPTRAQWYADAAWPGDPKSLRTLEELILFVNQCSPSAVGRLENWIPQGEINDRNLPYLRVLAAISPADRVRLRQRQAIRVAELTPLAKLRVAECIYKDLLDDPGGSSIPWLAPFAPTAAEFVTSLPPGCELFLDQRVLGGFVATNGLRRIEADTEAQLQTQIVAVPGEPKWTIRPADSVEMSLYIGLSTKQSVSASFRVKRDNLAIPDLPLDPKDVPPPDHSHGPTNKD